MINLMHACPNRNAKDFFLSGGTESKAAVRYNFSWLKGVNFTLKNVIGVTVDKAVKIVHTWILTYYLLLDIIFNLFYFKKIYRKY
jgi:hypothetical protein